MSRIIDDRRRCHQGLREAAKTKRVISRILFLINEAMIISLWMPVARHLLQPTRRHGRAALTRLPIWSCSEWGLPCPACHHPGGELLPRRCTLTQYLPGRFVFCGTNPPVTRRSRYEPSCPAEFGLSSPARGRSDHAPASIDNIA